jgi:cellulose synthase/poly-beta-1,6-N-acetylglucosamine synthase-like glycosyltransferase
MALVFWISIALIAYVYLGYPALLYAVARMVDPRRQHASANPTSTPPYGVSIIIAARNEGARLAARLDNLLSLDYPAARRQIVVVSDGSTDDTLEVLERYHCRGLIDVVSVPPGGKALALNAGIERARFEIVAFADARQTFAPDALRELTSPFADPLVGAVTGELQLDAESACRRSDRDRRVFERRAGRRAAAFDRREAERRTTLRSTIADGVGLYWKYEKQMRRHESRIWSTLGATGAIYAIRRALYRPLPADTILDDVLTPMRIVLGGYRVVFNEKALAFDRAASDADAEARRKVRTLAGNYQILALEPALLRPWRNPVWLQYVSHKIGRLAVPYALLAALASSIVLASSHPFYATALAVQVLFYLLAGAGALLESAGRPRTSVAPVAASRPRAPRAEREVA